MADPLPEGITPGGRFEDWQPHPPAYVVVDIDGTLVGPDGGPSPAVATALRKVQAAGLPCGFATGRMRLAVEALWQQLRAVGPHVLHNGAEVRAGGRTLASWPLTPDQVRAVAGITRALGTYVEVYVERGYFVSDEREAAQAHWHMLGLDPLGLLDALDPDGDAVLKATFGLFGEEPMQPLLDALADAGLNAGPAHAPMTPGIRYVNATHPDASKGRALTAAAQHLGVPLAAVVAVGDAPNDLDMFAVAGTAIAMGQASDEVRAAAHLIVPAVTDDGAATALAASITWARAAAG